MAAQVASQPGITPHVHKARRASMQQIENNFEDMDSASAKKINEGVVTDDRSAPAIEAGTSLKNEQAVSRRASLAQIENGFANMSADSASKLREGVETTDRSAPKISPDVTIKPAIHKDVAKEAAVVSATKSAKRASLIQIADGFAGMDEVSAQRCSDVAVETDDRSAPVLEDGVAVEHEFARARRNSLDQIRDGFANLEADSAQKLNMGVQTDDRSDPIIDGDVKLKPALHKEAAKEAATVSGVKNAKRASMAQIDNGFAGLDEASASKFPDDRTDTDDRSTPAVEPGTAPTHEFATARRASLSVIASPEKPTLKKTPDAQYGDRSDPDICAAATLETITGGHAKARRASLKAIEAVGPIP